jgi:hypothetical protein
MLGFNCNDWMGVHDCTAIVRMRLRVSLACPTFMNGG